MSAASRKPFRWNALFYAIHSWTGVILGWLLLVCCISGTLVVYKMPLKAWANPALVSTPASDPLGPDQALARMRAHDPAAQVRLFSFPTDDFSIHQYTLEVKPAQGRAYRYWMNPSTGQIHKGLQSDFADFVLRLHGNLFLGKPGRWLVGFLGVLMVVSLASGLAFHWKKIARDAFRLRLGGQTRQAWSDLHKVVGVWAFPFHLVIAVTGGWLGIETLVKKPSPPPFAVAGDATNLAAPAPITQVLAAVQARDPQLRPTHVNYASHGAAGSSVRVQGQVPGARLVQDGQTMVVMDAATLAPLKTVDPTREGLVKRLLVMARPLHYGYWGGGFSEALYFGLGAALSALCLSGLIVWAERDKRKRLGPDLAGRVTAMERINLGVTAGLLVALTAMACLTALARDPRLAGAFSAVGDLRYLGGQDLTSSRALAPELGVFAALWALIGLALAGIGPARGWRWAMLLLAGLFLMLPVLSAVSVGGIAADFTRGAGEPAGLALICLLLCAACLAVRRRLNLSTRP